jgi:hypothetical protein
VVRYLIAPLAEAKPRSCAREAVFVQLVRVVFVFAVFVSERPERECDHTELALADERRDAPVASPSCLAYALMTSQIAAPGYLICRLRAFVRARASVRGVTFLAIVVAPL